MNRIVVIPFDLIEEYINAGRTYKEIEKNLIQMIVLMKFIAFHQEE